jgi:hypothetical protein
LKRLVYEHDKITKNQLVESFRHFEGFESIANDESPLAQIMLSEEMKNDDCAEDEYSIQNLMVLGLAFCPGLASNEARFFYAML